MGKEMLKEEERAVLLENELIDMHSLLHTNRILRKLSGSKDRPEEQVRSELIDSLNKIVQDNAGESALSFISKISESTLERVHGMNLSKDYTFEMGKRDITQMPYYQPPQPFMPQIPQHQPPFAIYYYKKTDENRAKARQIIAKILSNSTRKN